MSAGLNIYSAKLTGKVLVFLTFSKILALIIVIIGIYSDKSAEN